ncbi:cellulose binding domain-containing protein [Catellatospora sp. KI3]|uniref:cellulose binding domain-containing protein n=1 Tax=Catellatospora sp. KI3 TaxID=3041620 RepID=UPI0024823917|nr:cellulose binding domain-containing protein [Catellatospora sp. KI3]MDI1460540.1 cellulose binding domain-containing protein [Catellatospora sp. KI3]
MSKHRLREDDDTTLLPPTVEESGRGQRRGARPRSGRQPVIIGLATAALLVSGAAAWALVRPSGDPVAEFPMTGPSASGGAGFVDGFGVVTPSPLPTLRTQAPGAPSASPSSGAGPSVGASASAAPVVSVSPSGAAPVEAPGAGSPGGPGQTAALAVTYRLDPWWKGFKLEVTVRNNGSAPVDWRVRVQFPAGTDNQNWAVWSTAASTAPENVWVFAPLASYGKLAPGGYTTFGMTGLRSGTGDDFALVSCAVEGGTCVSAP